MNAFAFLIFRKEGNPMKLEGQVRIPSGCAISAVISKEGNQKYEIQTNPETMTLRNGIACEFEISIKPLCSLEIIDQLMIVSVDIKKGTSVSIPIQMNIKTDMSTRI